MFTLRALLDRHPTILLIDSASSRIQVGLLRLGHDPLWETAAEEAGTALFSLTEKLLARAASPLGPLPLSAIEAFLFCDGPGSVLGIRTAAVALRTWHSLHPRPSYAYTSLALVAHTLALTENLRDFSVISDARRETWHRVTVDSSGALSPLHRTPTAELIGPLMLPECFRHWSTLPQSVRTVPYDLASQLLALAGTPLFIEAPEPDAFLHEEPSYQTWTAKIHRAPAGQA
ncbi:peptidase M22 [Nibricoccus aquaticus]|uniref:Peptidase M22 n=1 Tax=Nibricoccus aquaticus TaxID=2576891 RepID=A0A290QGS0_9BACT|nr:peptidase M22 [Nibricoccus aquaticus]ATC65466.1 peptidase M22 [Nibricoccus aquaticus]